MLLPQDIFCQLRFIYYSFISHILKTTRSFITEAHRCYRRHYGSTCLSRDGGDSCRISVPRRPSLFTAAAPTFERTMSDLPRALRCNHSTLPGRWDVWLYTHLLSRMHTYARHRTPEQMPNVQSNMVQRHSLGRHEPRGRTATWGFPSEHSAQRFARPYGARGCWRIQQTEASE
jgi:hypothetical protein